MKVEAATCPACGANFDPLRSRAVMVVDGRIRAFCSMECRERGVGRAPAVPSPTGPYATIPSRTPLGWRALATEYKVLFAAAALSLVVFVALIVAGRRGKAAIVATPAFASSSPVSKSRSPDDGHRSDVWVRPLSGRSHRFAIHDQQVFGVAREGLPAIQCGGGRCAVDIEAAPGAVVMAVHDGVVEAVERDADVDAQRGREGRFIRINHNGGSFVSSYLELDGIREDLRPGIPIAAGEAIGTVGRGIGKGASAHLRFAISVRRSADEGELFLNPAPLLTLWPARDRDSTSLHAMERASRPSE